MASVRTHTRHTRNGTTTVHRHDRSTRGRSWHQMQKKPRRRRAGRLSARRGFRHLGRAFRYGRRRKTAAACAFGVLGSFELGAFAVSRGLMGLGVVAGLFCVVFFGPLVWSIRKDMRAARDSREAGEAAPAAEPKSTQRRNDATAQKRKVTPAPQRSRPRRSAASILRGAFGSRRSSDRGSGNEGWPDGARTPSYTPDWSRQGAARRKAQQESNARAFAAAGVKPSGRQHRAGAEQGSTS